MRSLEIQVTDTLGAALEEEARRREVALEVAAAELLEEALGGDDRVALERAAETMERRREVLRQPAS